MEWNELLKRLKYDPNLSRLLKEEGVGGRYAPISLSLASAKTDELLQINGDYIGIAYITGAGTCSIKLDHRHSREINLKEISEISSPFGKLYFTTDGGGGELKFYVGGALTARIKPIGSKVGMRDVSGSDMTPANDSRFVSHSGKHHKVTLTAADTAQRLMATSTKVRWAIISPEDKNIRWGFSSTVARAAGIGMKVTSGSFITVDYCDLYDIYWVNETAVETPIVQIEYVEEA